VLASRGPTQTRADVQPALFPSMLVALMMEAVRTSETSVFSDETTRHYIP
jgi:hypothetical protein